jgi:hypothetical protein
MTQTRLRRARVARWVVTCMLCLSGLPAHAGPPAPDGQWHFAVTPYVWLPTIHTKFDFSLPPDQGSTIENELGPKNLNFALLLNGEARLDNWAVTADLIYLDLSSSGSRVTSVGGRGDAIPIPRERNVATQTDLKAYTATLAGSYTVLRGETATMDALAGLRVLHPDAGMDWSLDSTIAGSGFTLQRSGHVEGNLTLWDGVVGVRGRAWFGDSGKWFVAYYGDVGAGDSALTWQAFAALGYTLGWGEALVGYRYLSYDQSDEKLVQDMTFKGPLVGLSFRF